MAILAVVVVGGLGACSPGVDLTKEERATGSACALDAAVAPEQVSGAPPFTKIRESSPVPGLREVLGAAVVDGVLRMVGQGEAFDQYFLAAQSADDTQLTSIPSRPFGLEVIGDYAITRDLDSGAPMRIALASGEVTRGEPVPDEPIDMQISPDGSRAYLALNLRGVITVVDLPSGSIVCEIPVVSGGDAPLTLSRDGVRIFRGFSGGGGSTYHVGLEVLNRETGETLALVETSSPARAIALSPDESVLAALTSLGKKLVLIDPETLTQIGAVELPGEGDAIHWHDGYAYVRAFGPGVIWVVDVQAQTVVATIEVPFLAYDMAFGDDAAYVVGEQVVVLDR